MGYTHYWTFKSIQPDKTLEDKYRRAIKQCNKVIKGYNDNLKKVSPKHADRLSGFSAHVKPNKYKGIHINGTANLSHEDFILRETYVKNFEGFGQGFNFCKTARKPYDRVVTACLIILKHYLGDAIEVSSDGTVHDFAEGMLLARGYTKLKGLNFPQELDYTLSKVL